MPTYDTETFFFSFFLYIYIFIAHNLSILMYIMCVILCLSSALRCRVDALQMSILLIIINNYFWSILFTQFCLTSTETVWTITVLGTRSPGCPPRLSYSCWAQLVSMFLFLNTYDPCTLFWTSATILGSTSQAMTCNSKTDNDLSLRERDKCSHVQVTNIPSRKWG